MILTKEECATFRAAAPFPHVVFDGLFDDELLDLAASEFPPPESPAWKTYKDHQERGKQECQSSSWIGSATAELLMTLNLLDFDNLESDLSPSLTGGGMHQSPGGARLSLHTDFNYHPDTHMLRRLNVLLFLNRDWPHDGGGELVLGIGEESITIVPEANRLVIFEASDHSIHGHPTPVRADLVRRSLATYFYAPPGASNPPAHSTVWFS